MTTQRVLLSFFFFFFLGGLNSHVFKIGCSSKPLRSNQASPSNPIKIDFSIYRLFDEIDFSIIKNLPGNSTVGNFGQLRADGQLHKIFEQVQNRFHWDKALGGRLFCHLGKTVTPYSLVLLGASIWWLGNLSSSSRPLPAHSWTKPHRLQATTCARNHSCSRRHQRCKQDALEVEVVSGPVIASCEN